MKKTELEANSLLRLKYDMKLLNSHITNRSSKTKLAGDFV